MKRALLALSMLALAAAPVAASPIYLPAAIHETDGAYTRATELWVTNPDTLTQGFVVRYIATNADGTVRTEGDESAPYYIEPGESKRYTNLVPEGFRGMLELSGAGVLQFNGILTARNVDSTIVGEAEVPVLTQADLAASGSSLTLQGWQRSGTSLTTNLGVVNAAHTAAHCTVSIRQRSGLLIVQNVGIDLSPLTLLQFDDVLAGLGMTTVQDGARSEITCDQSFWTYISTYDDQTGAVKFIEPSTWLGSSTLTKPTGSDPDPDPDPDPPPGDAVVFTRNGEMVRYPMNNNGSVHNYRVDLPFSGSRRFSEITVDFDFHVGGWDPRKPNGIHCIMWLNNGNAWSNMFGYVNALGPQGNTKFRINNTGHGMVNTTNSGSPHPGGDYHMRYEYDLTRDKALMKITTASGSPVVSKTINLTGTTFQTSGFFIEFGYQKADEGPESYTPGWTFSNLRAVFIP